VGMAWSPANKIVLRASGAASYAPLKSIGGSAHFQGFAQILTIPDQTGVSSLSSSSRKARAISLSAIHRPDVRKQRRGRLVAGTVKQSSARDVVLGSPCSAKSNPDSWSRPATARSSART
jgi:hypothetical protein